MYFTGFMNFTGKFKNAFGSGGLSRINVGKDTDISVVS
jgi:hypothetical protein